MRLGVRCSLCRAAAAMLAFIAVAILCPESIAQTRVIGYYPMWAKGVLPPAGIRYDFLTHISHAFAWPNTDGSIAAYESPVDTGLINVTHRAGRKILLSFGGAGQTQTANFALVAASPSLRAVFIANVVAHIISYHYDGVDLDWEGPADTADKAHEVALVGDLRAALSAVDSSLLVTMAIGMTDYSGQWRDYAALAPNVDWFNAMAYDFYGSWSATTGHNAPLYAPPRSGESSIDQGVAYLAITRGIPRSKLALGLPFYGKEFFGASALHVPFTSELDLTYRDVLTAAAGWTYNWDNTAKVPFYTNATLPGFITFDDSASLANKCVYARNNSLSGVMIWEITQDVLPGGQPLMEAVGGAMYGTSGIAEHRSAGVPEDFTLQQNFPNPFNPGTTISYTLGQAGSVTLEIYAITGQLVMKVLADAPQARGGHQVTVDLGRLASGVYIYTLRQGTHRLSRLMTLVK